jgi:protein-S-isoprenylcysteine O-methyltransferase Ste14
MRWWNGAFQGFAAHLPVAALVLIPAGLMPGGTWLWLHGLAFAVAYVATYAIAGGLLAAFRPASLKVRRQKLVSEPQKKQPAIDAVGSVFLVVYWLAWLVFIPLDVVRLHLLPAPSPAVQAIGGVALLAGLILPQLAIWQNEFAAPNVQAQTGQRVVDTGVYSLVRHPIYAGHLLLYGGAALWLGSTAAFAGVSVMLVMTVGRILIEERYLLANLPGYAAYAARVRARLIPFLV